MDDQMDLISKQKNVYYKNGEPVSAIIECRYGTRDTDGVFIRHDTYKVSLHINQDNGFLTVTKCKNQSAHSHHGPALFTIDDDNEIIKEKYAINSERLVDRTEWLWHRDAQAFEPLEEMLEEILMEMEY